MRLRHGLFLPPFGELSDPRRVVEVAVAAERGGWDGIFLWDHMIRRAGEPQEIADPWIVLAAVAASTERILLGPMVTPLARRRPQKVARETVTLDRLSNGRLVLGVGLGVNSGGELERFGECVDDPRRAEMLDEALQLLLDLWSGKEVDHRGRHYTASGVRFLPGAVQEPRIPVWVAARGTTSRRGPLVRAARLDGLFPVDASFDQLEWMAGVIRSERGSLEGFDFVVPVPAGVSARAGPSTFEQLRAVGATWAMWSVGLGAGFAGVRELASHDPRATE